MKILISFINRNLGIWIANQILIISWKNYCLKFNSKFVLRKSLKLATINAFSSVLSKDFFSIIHRHSEQLNFCVEDWKKSKHVSFPRRKVRCNSRAVDWLSITMFVLLFAFIALSLGRSVDFALHYELACHTENITYRCEGILAFNFFYFKLILSGKASSSEIQTRISGRGEVHTNVKKYASVLSVLSLPGIF